MRFKRNTFLVGGAILLCLLVWWMYSTRNKVTPQTIEKTVLLPATNSMSAPKPVVANNETNLASKPEDDWSWTNQVPVEQRAWLIERVSKMKQLLSVANPAIVFYGQILDQFGQPVPGVRVETHVAGLGVNSFVTHEMKGNTNTFFSDASGRFVISGLRGESLSFHLFKEGYELAPQSPLGFDYGPGVAAHHEPNPTNPVVYRMWKRQGAAELKGFYNRGMIPSDGQSIWIAENSEKWSRTELPDSILKLTVNRKRRVVTFDDKSHYQWGVEVNMLGGGVQKTDDPFLYESPESGYSSVLSIRHEAGDANWIWEQRIVFYFRTKTGKFGHGEMFISNWQNQDEIYCELGLTWNPDGSRNLEPKPE